MLYEVITLNTHGDPYQITVLDIDGRTGIDFGVYGVPETFLIDKKGVIRYKQIGPVTPEALQDVILPKVVITSYSIHYTKLYER